MFVAFGRVSTNLLPSELLISRIDRIFTYLFIYFLRIRAFD